MKSLRSSGSATRSRTRARKPRSPSKNCSIGEHRDRGRAAAAYSPAISAGSAPARIAPADGDARLISASTRTGAPGGRASARSEPARGPAARARRLRRSASGRAMLARGDLVALHREDRVEDASLDSREVRGRQRRELVDRSRRRRLADLAPLVEHEPRGAVSRSRPRARTDRAAGRDRAPGSSSSRPSAAVIAAACSTAS